MKMTAREVRAWKKAFPRLILEQLLSRLVETLIVIEILILYLLSR